MRSVAVLFWFLAQVALAEVAPTAVGSMFVEPAVVAPGQTVKLTYRTNGARSVRKVTAHWGINGWTEPGTSSGSGREILDGKTYYFTRQTMTPQDSKRSVWSTSLNLPISSKGLHVVFCFDECKSGQWDNHGGRDFVWPVRFPYIGPYLTWEYSDRPDRHAIVAFEHPANAKSASPSLNDEGAWLELRQQSRPGMVRRIRYSGDISRQERLWRFRLEPLTPSTFYEYRVGFGGDFVSSWYQLKTLGSEAELRQTGIRFAVFGDSQDSGTSDRFRHVVQSLVRDHSDIDFLIATGDMTWNDRPGDWWIFFDRARELLATKIIMPTVGNHDTPGTSSSYDHTSFNYYFLHPGQRAATTHYDFTVGTARFLAMNSERPAEMRPGGAQYEWAAQILADRKDNLPTNPWNFAYWHKPPFNVGARHWRSQDDYRPITQLFDGVIDWHFGGHEHLYQRTKPVLWDGDLPLAVEQFGTKQGRGVGYLVVPSGGAVPEAQLSNLDDNPEAFAVLSYPRLSTGQTRVPTFNGYSRIELNQGRLRLTTYSGDTAGRFSPVDTVDYIKD